MLILRLLTHFQPRTLVFNQYNYRQFGFDFECNHSISVPKCLFGSKCVDFNAGRDLIMQCQSGLPGYLAIAF